MQFIGSMIDVEFIMNSAILSSTLSMLFFLYKLTVHGYPCHGITLMRFPMSQKKDSAKTLYTEKPRFIVSD